MSKGLEALKEYQEKVSRGEVERPKPLNPIEKLKTKPYSLRFSINAKCWDCTCGQRVEIKLCTCSDCPLFNVRPYQDKPD